MPRDLKECLHGFIEATKLKKDLDARLKDATADLKGYEEELLQHFEGLGVESLSAGDTTVYLHRQLWARAKDGNKEAVIHALKGTELEDMVQETFNTNTLSAWVRECEREGRAIPETLKDTLAITEDFSVRAVSKR